MFETKVSANLNQGGFAGVDDVKKCGIKIDYKKGTTDASGVGMLTDGETAYVLDDDGFYLVVGGTGSKKTRDVVAPYIYNNALEGNSMIISDIKGDLYKLLVKRLKSMGYKIVALNFNEPEKGDAYNPLLPIYRDYKSGNVDRANRALTNIADMLFHSVKSDKDPFWHNTAASYFMGCELTLFDLYDEKKATIQNALNLHIQGNTSMAKYYSERQETEAWKLIASTVQAPNETRASVHAVYVAALNKLIGQNGGIIRMTSHSTFEIEDIVKEKTAIFMISNEESLSAHSGLISALVQQWYGILVNIADAKKGTLDRKVVFVLDEFGNLPPIKDFQTKISLSRARGISWMIVLQSFAQLELQYGKAIANTIIGNTTNWIYLFSPDLEILTHISKLCGDVTDDYTEQVRKLLSVNQLRHFQKYNDDGRTECLMLLGRMKPFVTYLPDISEYYGIDPVECLDIAEREDEEPEPINFKELVEELNREKFQRMLRESEEERRRIAEELERKRNEEIKKNPYNMVEIMNDVISNLIREGDKRCAF